MMADAEVLRQAVFVNERDPDQEIVQNGLGVDSVRRIEGRILSAEWVAKPPLFKREGPKLLT
jgi:hypothetical protein